MIKKSSGFIVYMNRKQCVFRLNVCRKPEVFLYERLWTCSSQTADPHPGPVGIASDTGGDRIPEYQNQLRYPVIPSEGDRNHEGPGDPGK